MDSFPTVSLTVFFFLSAQVSSSKIHFVQEPESIQLELHLIRAEFRITQLLYQQYFPEISILSIGHRCGGCGSSLSWHFDFRSQEYNTRGISNNHNHSMVRCIHLIYNWKTYMIIDT